MWERDTIIRVSRQTIEASRQRGQTFESWFDDQRSLAEVIDEGRVFQKVGGEYLMVKITDINPLGEPSEKMEPKGSIGTVKIPAVFYRDIKNKPKSFRDWALRVMNLGLRVENMDLYLFNEGEYCSIHSDLKDPDE